MGNCNVSGVCDDSLKDKEKENYSTNIQKRNPRSFDQALAPKNLNVFSSPYSNIQTTKTTDRNNYYEKNNDQKKENVVPLSFLSPTPSTARAQTLLQDALSANKNMVMQSPLPSNLKKLEEKKMRKEEHNEENYKNCFFPPFNEKMEGLKNFVEQNFGNFDYELPVEYEQFLNKTSLLPIQSYSTSIGYYQGQLKDGYRYGRGKQLWSDGSYYEGYWRDDQAYAKGRLIHSSGDVYDGFWENDMASGQGLYYSYECSLYNGTWVKDKQEGYGVEIWQNGEKYEGQYSAGLKNGKGTFFWADGSSYEGDFEYGIIGGKGSYKWADGRVYKGEWKNGKLHGKGIYQWPDNRVYAGDFFEDEIHGFGLMMMADGSSLQGEWRFGEKV